MAEKRTRKRKSPARAGKKKTTRRWSQRVTEESDAHQYRFQTLIDPESGAPLFEIEHEVRSLRHPLWGRAFVNRNPDQTQREYVPGRDAYAG